jgi:hypothetical protein
VADRGWTYNEAERAWELLNRCGFVIRRIGLPFLDQFGPGQLNNYGARHGWPELVPGAPWVVCVMEGGPMDGRRWFGSPAEHSGPPMYLAFSHRGARLVYWRRAAVRPPARCSRGRSGRRGYLEP